MKKAVILVVILGLAVLSCSKKTITNNYYGPTEEGASIVGVVYPPESEATVTAYMGIPVASAQIDAAGYFQFSGLPVGPYSLLVQAEGYYDQVSETYVKEPTITLVDTIYLARFGEFISWVSPYDGQQMVSVDASIRIAFRTEIDRESFEAAFDMEPLVEGRFSWREYFPPGGPPEVRFYPRDQLATSTIYQVTIDTTVSDTAGMKLTEPYQSRFTTEPVRIEYTYPGHNHVSVSPKTTIRIRFNAYMNTESVEAAFTMMNSELEEVTGDFYWSSLTYLEFEPSPPLATDERYTVTIEATASDVSGSTLPAPYWFSFVTQPLMVTSTSPADQSSSVPTSTGVWVFFNTHMDAESVNSAFQMVDSELKTVTGEYIWPSLSYIVFQPVSPLAGAETYTVTIDASAKDLHGKSLDGPFSFWFRTASE